jgi:serine/threonine protein kinase
MSRELKTCKRELIEHYLIGSLDSYEEAVLMEHLHACSQCREQMESAAADPVTWGDAEKFLRASENNLYEFRYMPPSMNGFDEAASIRGIEISAEIAQVLSQLDPTDDPQMLGRLGGYEVSGVVGSGGMGVVLKAFDRPLDRTVAIKVLAPRLASSGAARLRFAREAKAAATVLHPNVIVIHGVSIEGELPFLVMPYLRGESLQRRLDRKGSLPTEEIVRIAQQIAAGLAAAHGQGLVHRDIKPANIMLEDGVERVTLTDFGLARAVDDASMTRSGVVTGTPQYMSPEQARGDVVDARSDLFSLGSVLYAMCTGHPPFRAESSYGTLRRITDTDPRPIREVNPSIPEWLERIVLRLHTKPVENRFQTAEQVSAVLQKCLAHLQQPLAFELPEECRAHVRQPKFWQGSKLFVPFVAMTILVGGALVGGAIAGSYFIGKSISRSPAPLTVHPVPPSPNPNRDENHPALSAWDSMQSDIEAFERDVSSFEAEASRSSLEDPRAAFHGWVKGLLTPNPKGKP